MAHEGNRPKPEPEFASPDEVRRGLAAFKPPDIARLRQAALSLGVGLLLELPDDLLMIAIARTAEGTRGWNRKLPLDKHLYGAMLSITEELREKQSRHFRRHVAQPAEDSLLEVGDHLPNAEQVLVRRVEVDDAAAQAQKVTALFKEDDEATTVLLGLSEGMSAEEIRATFDFTETQYKTIRKRIRRKVNDRFPRGLVDAN